MIVWLKPNGVTVETNEMTDTVDYCLGLGWKPMVKGEAVDLDEDLDASGTLFDPDIHWKNRRKDADGNWMVKKA